MEVPCPSPAFTISSLLPWSQKGGCGGDTTCSSCGGSLGPVYASSYAQGGSSSIPSVFSCSSQGAVPPNTTPAAAADASVWLSGSAGQDTGVMRVEREVVLAGCPMNSYPGKNVDNHLCIMCGELHHHQQCCIMPR